MLCQAAHGFVARTSRTVPSRPSPPPCNFVIGADSIRIHAAAGGSGEVGVELVSLAGLGDDHQAVGEAMGKSVAAWLDAEWMPQEVHVKMGTSVQNTYVSCRSKGMDDVSQIMTEVTDDLYARWSEYNADAFVNAWDIGNYVADYLIAKSGSETCGCSTQIVE